MSQKQTSQQCNHISRVKEWGFDDNHNFRASLYDCINCGVESSTPFVDKEVVEIDHSNCNYDPCFGCKAKGLQLNTGDAGRPASQKSLDSRLGFYREARAAGIQPSGTHPVQVQAAYEASDKLGKAYDAGTMIRADKVTKNVAAIMKEVD